MILLKVDSLGSVFFRKNTFSIQQGITTVATRHTMGSSIINRYERD
jgi:hypothetical protein